MSISDKFSKLEKEIDKAGIDAYRARHDSGQNMDSKHLSTEHFYLDSIKYATNRLTSVPDSYKNQAPIDNEIGTSLPKNIKNVASNFKREMGKQPMDGEYLFHFCDSLPNGHDLTDDELGWPNGIPITINRFGKVVAVMEDMKYVEVNQPQFNSIPTLDHTEFYPNPTRYILRQDSVLYISEDLNQWKKLYIGDLHIYENQICCDHDGIVYLLCDNNIARVVDPDKYAYATDGSVPIYDLTITEYPGQDLKQSASSTNPPWIIVGINGLILRSTDNGLTWSKMTSAIGSYLRRIYYSNNTWIVVGTSGTILRSIDDGLTWTKITVSGVTTSLQNISYSNNTWIIVGQSGTIVRSIDNGLTWTKITVSGISSWLYGISYANNTWIIVGIDGLILRSTDDGLTWTKIAIGVNSNLLNSYYSNDTWITTGTNGVILRSTDNGLNWTNISVSGVNGALYGIYYSNDTWITIGESGTILRSTDDGLTWTKISVSGISGTLYNIASCAVPTFLRYGGTQFRTNYNFAEYFVSNTTPLSIAGNVVGSSDTEEPGFIGKIEGSNSPMKASKSLGFNLLADGDLIGLGGALPYFIKNNPMDIGYPDVTQKEGIYKDYDITFGLSVNNGIFSINYEEIADYFNTPIDNIYSIKYPFAMANWFSKSIEGALTEYPYYFTANFINQVFNVANAQPASFDIIKISPSRYFVLGKTFDLVLIAVSLDNISTLGDTITSMNMVPESAINVTRLPDDYTDFSTTINRNSNLHAHMTRGGDFIYIWVHDSTSSEFKYWRYNIITDSVEYITDSKIQGSIQSICASNTPHAIHCSDYSMITSDIFFIVQNGTNAPEYYYMNYAYDDMARLTKFDPGNKYTASQTAGETMTRLMLRFNDKSIYYNRGNVFIRLDYYDSNTSADDYLGPIKHKYLMCGLNNTSNVLRKIESTDMRTGSFVCTSMTMNVPFIKRNTLNTPTKMQLSDYPSEEFTPDIIVLYNEEFNYGRADSDTLGVTQETSALSNSSFAMVFTKDIYSLDGDSYTNKNPDFGTTIVRNGSLENGVRYVTRGLQNNPIDLILYHDHMEINLSAEFLGTKISYLALGQRGAALYPYI